MESQNSPSKRESSNLPMASHGDAVETLYDWLRNEVRETQYGEVGISLKLHQGEVTRVTKTVVLSGSTRVDK